MVKKLSIILALLVSFIFIFTGCNRGYEKVKDIKYKVLVDKLPKSNICASLYYDGIFLDGRKSTAYTWKDKKLSKDNSSYDLTFTNTYPLNSIKKIQKHCNLPVDPEDVFGQVYFYGTCNNYELVIFDSHREGLFEWQVFFLSNNEIKQITVKRLDKKDHLNSFQITKDAVYLFTTTDKPISDVTIYKINTSNYQVSNIIIPCKSFGNFQQLIIKHEKIFIHDDTLLISTSEFNGSFRGKGVFIKYNLKTNTANTYFVDYNVDKTFVYKNGYLVIGTGKKPYRPMLKYYDKDFNLLNTKHIDVKSSYGNIMVDELTYMYAIHDDKLYGAMVVAEKKINYLTVIDIKTANVLFLAELVNTNHEYNLGDYRYYIDKNGILANLDAYYE